MAGSLVSWLARSKLSAATAVSDSHMRISEQAFASRRHRSACALKRATVSTIAWQLIRIYIYTLFKVAHFAN
jgi:hypothetical protein